MRDIPVTTIQRRDLIRGEIYFFEYDNYNCLVQIDLSGSTVGKGIQLRDESWISSNDFSAVRRITRVASEEEKIWFRSCAEAKRFVKRSVINNSYEIY